MMQPLATIVSIPLPTRRAAHADCCCGCGGACSMVRDFYIMAIGAIRSVLPDMPILLHDSFHGDEWKVGGHKTKHHPPTHITRSLTTRQPAGGREGGREESYELVWPGLPACWVR